jgi:8-amino-7-oxononanoate synthase
MPPSTFSTQLQEELATLAAADRLRTLAEVDGSSRVTPRIGGRPMLAFCTNDYLDLAAHPALAAAAAQAATRDGFGPSASRLVAGDLPAHRELETALAAHLRRPAALVFPTGYQANLGVLVALAGRDDLIVSDALNHASIVDGCRLSRARVAVYPHRDVRAAAQLLADSHPFRRRLLVTESLFSMDGDVAPLADLADAAARTNAVLVVDEAHAFATLGPEGRGLSAAAGVVPDVFVATLGKSIGSAGGFVAGAQALRDVLINRARTFIYTTALPPPVAAAAAAGLALAAGPEGARRRDVLAARCSWLADRLQTVGLAAPPHASEGPIFPIVLGADTRALAVAASLRDRGLFVPAIRPPTVHADSARLRLTLSAAHTPDDLEWLLAALVEATQVNP